MEVSDASFAALWMAQMNLLLVTSCSEPNEVWDRLREDFECETLATEVFRLVDKIC